MIIIKDVEQGSEQWHQLRTGVVTASNFSNIITAVKGDYSKSADKYMIKLIAQQLTGEIDETYSSASMDRGSEMEAEARSWYEFTQGEKVEQVGFVFKDERKLIGCSPDGMMNEKTLEIKCVIGSTMVTYLLADETYIVNQYKQQTQGSLFVTGFDQCDLLIYHPSFNQTLITVKRDDEYIRKMEMAIARFLKEMDEKIKRIKK